MKYKINSTYEVNQVHEFSADISDLSFLIIYGHHINGWFIAIPNWGICTEASGPSSVGYNATKLGQTPMDGIDPMCLAQAIRDHWESADK